jgi:hypothetical protein
MTGNPEEAEKRGDVVAYCYVGSHNFSKSAWGVRVGVSKRRRRLNLLNSNNSDASTPLPSLRCNSLELGVLLSTRSATEARSWLAALPFNPDAPKYSTDELPFDAESEPMPTTFGLTGLRPLGLEKGPPDCSGS